MPARSAPRPDSLNTDILRQWGRNLALTRKAAGYPTHAALATELGRTAAAVSAWERGINAPRDAEKLRIATLLNVTVVELFPLDGTNR